MHLFDFTFFQFYLQCCKYSISGQVDRASATEAVDPASIPGRDKPKTIKICIHCFLALRSAIKSTV